MAAKVVIAPAREEDAVALAARMRSSDADEVKASGGYDPLAAVRESLDASYRAFTMTIDGEVAAVYGVVPLTALGDKAVGWLLTSDVVDKHPLAFLRHSRQELARLLEMFPVLCNAIDARYTKALRWANWLGFEVGPSVPFGAEGRPFHPICITKEALDV